MQLAIKSIQRNEEGMLKASVLFMLGTQFSQGFHIQLLNWKNLDHNLI